MGQRTNDLADDFSLYFRLHAEVTPIACESSGLDVQAHVQDFRSANGAESARARRAYAVPGTDYDTL